MLQQLKTIPLGVIMTSIVLAQGNGASCRKYLETGEADFKAGSFQSALNALNAAIQCDSALLEAHLLIGDAYLRTGNESEALRAYTQALAVNPHSVRALQGAASIYLRNDNNEKATPLLETLTALAPSDVHAHVDLGASYAATGRQDDAEKEFQKAIQLDRDDPSALTGMGNLLQKQGHADQALVVLKRAAKLAPHAFEPHFLLGAIYNSQAKYPEAAEELETSLQLGGTTSSEIYYQLARAYQNLGRSDDRQKALAEFNRIYDQQKKAKDTRNEVFLLTSKAGTLVEAGDLKGAVAILQQAVALATPDDHLLFRLAGLQYDLKQYEPATENVEKAIALAPTVWLYYFLHGLIETDRGNLPEARKSLQLAIRLNPSAAEAHNALGQLALAEKDWPLAVASFKRAVDLEPQEESFRNNLESARHAAEFNGR